MRLSLDAVETLEAIAEEGSFAGAARRLHKAQSAVSYAIRQLEGSLGVPVFDRTGHRAALTPAGVALLDEGRLLLARARRMEWLGAQLAAGWEARLDLIVDGAVPAGPILRALKQLGDEGVPTHVQLTMEFLSGVQRRFDRDGADLMIAFRVRRGSHLDVRPLPPVRMVLVAASAHPVLAVSEPHSALSLAAHLELSVHDSSEETRGTDTNDIGGARVFYLSDFHTKRQALLMGLGFGWMPEALVEADLASGSLQAVPYTAGSRREMRPWLVHRVDRPLGPAAQRLLRLVQESSSDT